MSSSTMMPPIKPLPELSNEFAARLGSDAIKQQNRRDDPNYYAETPQDLNTKAHIHSFTTGTGEQLWETFLPIIESARHEVIIVTCFWAASATLDKLNAALRSLSTRQISRAGGKIRVRMCFSSSSLFQKLFHSQKAAGQSYAPEKWHKQLGLPPASELQGLDLEIKSVFQLPFSVMHPKFIIVDRRIAILPSCNISWESWFEGATGMRGPIVQQFLTFYAHFWERTSVLPALPGLSNDETAHDTGNFIPSGTAKSRPSHAPAQIAIDFCSGSSIESAALFLPSPHHRNPHFQPFARQAKVRYPHTPLNSFLLLAFAKAERSIRIFTPNLTAPPVLWALLSALRRGVDVHITTSANLMVLEQLVTGGTTTKRCLKKLVKRYEKLCSSSPSSTAGKSSRPQVADEEACLPGPGENQANTIGKLKIDFFAPKDGPKTRGNENGEPQHLHLKMSVVDDEVLVLGSGNMDRASWYTSQELGVAFFEREMVEKVGEAVGMALEGRREEFFNRGRV